MGEKKKKKQIDLPRIRWLIDPSTKIIPNKKEKLRDKELDKELDKVKKWPQSL